jgi:hypothetical protein
MADPVQLIAPPFVDVTVRKKVQSRTKKQQSAVAGA